MPGAGEFRPPGSGIRAGIRRLFSPAVFRADRTHRELEAEIAFHLEERTRQLMREGLSRAAAETEARRRFGDVAQARLHAAVVRREERLRMRETLDSIASDLRYVVRSLARSPAVTITIACTLALGIGANAAMFGIIDRLLLRGPGNVREPDRVMRLYRTEEHRVRGAQTYASMGYVSYTLMREAASFEGVAAYAPSGAIVGSGADVEEVHMEAATWDLFPLLGVRPEIGRFFDAAEDAPSGGAQVVVLAHAFWTRRFGADRGILGRSVTINGAAYTVIGVAPGGFTGATLLGTALWTPMALRGASTTSNWTGTWNAQWLNIVARLRPGVAPAAAEAEATALHRRAYDGGSRSLAEARMTLAPIAYDRSGREAPESAVARWLTGVSILVLLIAAANVANLLLARTIRRRRDIAVRMALGIGRARLVRMLILESLALALLGGSAGLLVALVGAPVVRAVLLPDIAWVASPVSGRVLAVALLVTTATGLLVGLAPAWLARGQLAAGALNAGARDAGVQRSRLRGGLLFVQSALAVVLVIGAGLFVRSLATVRSLDLGFEPARVLQASLAWPALPREVTPEQRTAERARRQAVYEQARTRALAMPEVRAAAIAVGTPFGNAFGASLRVPGHDSIPELGGGGPYVSAVTPGYFATVGTALLRGREFAAADVPEGERVTIVNEPMARTLWPAEDALGKCLLIFADTIPCARVVGVVAEARRFSLREPPAMQYYVPLGQEVGFGGSVLLVRPRGEPERLMEPLRRMFRDLDPNQYARLRLMQDGVDPQIRPWRLGATLFGVFGALALAVAAIGLYSVIAYMVAQRTREFGVRMALGARGRNIAALVVARGLAPVAAGLAVGLLAALAAGRFVAPLLFETSPRDPLVLGLAATTLLLVSVLACVVPARRATRVDPVVALREE